jgi:hypothetical protein
MGLVRMAVAQAANTVEAFRINNPAGPARQDEPHRWMHHTGLFDEYQDLPKAENPQRLDLMTVA